jgi:hypothetical protein
MTVFYKKVFNEFSKQIGFTYKHYNDYYKPFLADPKHPNSISSLNNVTIDFEKLPTKYIGSHFIRDPRDLLVSGYRYHKWCKEAWAIDSTNGKSYQQKLNELDETSGYLLELDRMRHIFKAMGEWDFENPNILELKYEDIFNNEINKFNELFEFYELPKAHQEKFISIVDGYSFSTLKKQNKTGKQKHAEIGYCGQWRELIPSDVLNVFMQEYGSLIEMLKYEKN